MKKYILIIAGISIGLLGSYARADEAKGGVIGAITGGGLGAAIGGAAGGGKGAAIGGPVGLVGGAVIGYAVSKHRKNQQESRKKRRGGRRTWKYKNDKQYKGQQKQQPTYMQKKYRKRQKITRTSQLQSENALLKKKLYNLKQQHAQMQRRVMG